MGQERGEILKYLRMVAMRLLLLSCFMAGALDFSLAQVSIPSKYDGFVYRGGSLWEGSVIVEAFFDPMCPDSRDSWPPLKQVLQFFHPRVSLIVHPFALPYHSNSYASCRALHIANKLNASSTYPLLELFFLYQKSYYNAPTYNTSMAFIINQFSKIAEEAVGLGSYSAIISGFNDSRTDMSTRISFKYGCSRGVMGTPYFFVNGIPLPDYGFALNYSKWRSIIGPLLMDEQ
ncbi:hypothetical protein HPP92_021879 [Vanilla planifolia]|uniref:Thioredoxin-like fold domain-containing protein n=1 Tax=Vanilla planifolia TaxID=51239 RepID=A0A835PR72_VANPL|nr:hypothetical protein HPP92_022203 [Vanilla planifolia]KAG0458751.1 hypothetical protein HPP92_021879 [Vanilla planifolia]